MIHFKSFYLVEGISRVFSSVMVLYPILGCILNKYDSSGWIWLKVDSNFYSPASKITVHFLKKLEELLMCWLMQNYFRRRDFYL